MTVFGEIILVCQRRESIAKELNRIILR